MEDTHIPDRYGLLLDRRWKIRGEFWNLRRYIDN